MFKQVVIATALLSVVFVAPVAGQPSDNNGRPDRSIVPPYPLKDRQCVHDCRSEASQCLADAREASAPCFRGCQPLVEAARVACADDPESEACEQARTAARACLEPCYEMLRPAVNACIDAGHQCVRRCPFIGEPPCITACRVDHIDCLGAARAALNACRATCSDEIQAAREACTSDPESEACSAAKEAVHLCLQPCREGLKDDLVACQTEFYTCVEACGGDGAEGN